MASASDELALILLQDCSIRRHVVNHYDYLLSFIARISHKRQPEPHLADFLPTTRSGFFLLRSGCIVLFFVRLPNILVERS